MAGRAEDLCGREKRCPLCTFSQLCATIQSVRENALVEISILLPVPFGKPGTSGRNPLVFSFLVLPGLLSTRSCVLLL
jgi:hypothetical protein